jgi:hypothetical protein
MEWLTEILPIVLDRGIGAIFLVALLVLLVTLAKEVGRILAETYTKPVADTVARTLANWLAVLTAVVMSRLRPGAVEALKVQLEYLDAYQKDGLTGFKLLAQAVDFVLRMRATAADEQTTLVRRRTAKRERTAVTGALDVTQDDQASSAGGVALTEHVTVEIASQVTVKDAMNVAIGPAIEHDVARPVRPTRSFVERLEDG